MGKKKLVIIKLARTGSTMLSYVLNNHPHCIITPEILNNVNTHDINKKIEYINNFLNKSDKNNIFGITINLNKYCISSINDLYKFIDHDTYTIILLRKSILKKIVSEHVVLNNKNLSNNWGLYNTNFNKKININMQSFTESCEREKNHYDFYYKIYNDLKKKNYQTELLYYEDLIENTKYHIDSIFNNLGLVIPDNFEYYPTKFHKLLSNNLEDIIINYDEVIKEWNNIKLYKI
jgi:hypothetical protein